MFSRQHRLHTVSEMPRWTNGLSLSLSMSCQYQPPCEVLINGDDKVWMTAAYRWTHGQADWPTDLRSLASWHSATCITSPSSHSRNSCSIMTTWYIADAERAEQLYSQPFLSLSMFVCKIFCLAWSRNRLADVHEIWQVGSIAVHWEKLAHQAHLLLSNSPKTCKIGITCQTLKLLKWPNFGL